MKLSAVIVDDELHARENLSMLIKEYCPDIAVQGMAHDVESGLRQIQEHDPDLLFLDIRMPSGAEGFELLQKLDSPRFMVVFVTAFKDYAIDAFKVNAVDYILKPIDIDELIETVERLIKLKQRIESDTEERAAYSTGLKELSSEMIMRSQRITVPHASGIKVIRIEDLVYLKAEGNCTLLVFKDASSYLDTRTLKHYEGSLSSDLFLRPHRSYMVKLDEVEEFSRKDGNHLILRSGAVIPVARNQVQSVLDRIGSL